MNKHRYKSLYILCQKKLFDQKQDELKRLSKMYRIVIYNHRLLTNPKA